MVSFRGQDDLSPNDLLRDFSESPVTVCRRGQREHLWSKVLNDTPSGCLADSGVNEKRFCIGFALVLALCHGKPADSGRESNGENQTARISLTAHFFGHRKAP
jgi:hypothetical protein